MILKDLILKIDKSDITKFFVYTLFFLMLFVGYNKTVSPNNEHTLNSAAPEKIEQENTDSFEIWKKVQEKPYLSISFQPNSLKIDNDLLKMLQQNAYSKFFKDKILPLDLVLDWDRIEPRWQVSGNKLILSSNIKLSDETMKVFTHELGHIVDLYYLDDKDWFDLSDEFYRIDWIDFSMKKKDAKISDFVSWYALSNKYEDFAESFTFYIFHNEDFATRALINKSLKLKYDFFKKYIFTNDEFFNTSFWIDTIKPYNWDTTKISINLKKYLYYVQ